MFDNIGGKIKVLAKVVCWIGIAISVLYAVVLWSQRGYYQDTTILGLVVLVLGCLASWVGSFFTYGFGELIERVSGIDNKITAVINTSISNKEE